MAPRGVYEARARIFKALGHPSRLLIVDALQEGPKNVAELVSLVGDGYATVSRHLSLLKETGLVAEDRKEGNMVFYRLECPCVGEFFRCVAQVLKRRRSDLGRALGARARTGKENRR